MPIARSLFELQQIDNAMLRLQREKSRLDDGSALRAQRDTLQKALAVEEENLSAHNRARVEAEQELQRREEKLRTQQTRLMNAKSAHEVDSLQRDIDSITKSRGELEEAILVAMDEAETTAGKLDQLRAKLEEVSAELAQVEANFSAENVRIDEELMTAARQRNAAAAGLDEESREQYNTVGKKHGGVAVAAVENGNCSACGNMITPYNLKEAKNLEWPKCESCGRLLYVETA